MSRRGNPIAAFSRLVLLMVLCFFHPVGVRATTYYVTTMADTGPGSLRQAVTDAIANFGSHIINFTILGPGPYAIRLQSALPSNTSGSSIRLVGQTQPNVNTYGGYVYVFNSPVPGPANFSLDSYVLIAPAVVLPTNGVAQLAEAVDATNLVWVNDPLVPWLLETNDTHDGIDALVSGPLGTRMSASFSTTVQGPLLVSFWWKAPTSAGNSATFSPSGRGYSPPTFSISSVTNWQLFTYQLEGGPQQLTWSFGTSSSASTYNNGLFGYVDQITFSQGTNAAPVILEFPGSQTLARTVYVGGTISNRMEVAGSPLNYFWCKDGVPVPGQTNYDLLLTNMQVSQSGVYNLVVSNALGVAVSSNFTCTVVSPQRIDTVGQILLPTNEVATAISTSRGPAWASNTDTVVVTTRNSAYGFPYDMPSGYTHVFNYDVVSSNFNEVFVTNSSYLAAALPSSVCLATGYGSDAGFDVIVIATNRQSASYGGHVYTPASATPTNIDVQVSLLSATARSNDCVVAVMLSAYQLPATNVILFTGSRDGLPPFGALPAMTPMPQPKLGGDGGQPAGSSPIPSVATFAANGVVVNHNAMVVSSSSGSSGAQLFNLANQPPSVVGFFAFAQPPSGVEKGRVFSMTDPDKVTGDQVVLFENGHEYVINVATPKITYFGPFLFGGVSADIGPDGITISGNSSGDIICGQSGLQTGSLKNTSTPNPLYVSVAGETDFITKGNSVSVITHTPDVTAYPPPITGKHNVTSSDPIPHDVGNAHYSADSGDPINMFDLEFVKDESPDLVRGGPLPLTFERSYASARRTSGFLISALGDNWAHNFDWRAVASATNALVISAHGEGFSFTKTGGVWSLVTPTYASFQLKDSGANLVFGDPRTRRLYTFNSGGQPVRIEDEHGNAHTLAYSGALLASVTDGLGRSLAFSYDISNRLAAVTADDGRSVGFAYGSNSALSAVTNALGNATRFSYSVNLNTGNNNLTAITNPVGTQPLFQIYNGQDGVGSQIILKTNTFTLPSLSADKQILDPLGFTRHFFHSASGSLTQMVDEAGVVLNVTNDLAGRPVAITDRNGNTSQIQRDPATGLPTAFITADTNSTAFTYVPRAVQGIIFQDLTQITYPDGATGRFHYDATGNVLAVTNRAGQPTFYGYNSRGQITAITNAVGGIVTFTYNPNGTLASRTDAETGTTTFAYDASLRLTNTVFSDGSSQSAQYDAGDRLIAATDARGNTTTFAYDANDRLTTVYNPLGQFMYFIYDDADRLINVRDFTGKISNYGYDKLSRVAAVFDRNGYTNRFAYDSRGRMSSFTDGAGKVWKMGYDAQAQFISATNPLAQVSSRALNKTGFTTATTNALGAVASFGRDSLQRVTASTDEAGRVFTNSYDAFSELGGIANAAIGGVNYFRDAGGRLTNLVDQTGGSWRFAWTPLGRLQNFTDPLNRATAFTRDGLGRVQRVSFADGASVTNSYDLADNLTRVKYSDGTDQPFTYDALDRLTNANNLSLAYDAMGRVTNTLSSGVNFAAAYDGEGQLTSVTYSNGAFTVNYTYDPRGLLTQISDTLSGAQINYAYDAAGRLTNSVRANGVNGIYDYDANGRLVRLREGGFIDQQLTRSPAGEPAMITVTAPLVAAPTNQSRALTFDAAHQITTAGYSFDARGRQTTAPGHAFSWNDAGRLTTADTATFTYNGLNQLLTRAQSGATIRYHYNHALGLAPIVAEQDAATGKILRYYVWSPGGPD